MGNTKQNARYKLTFDPDHNDDTELLGSMLRAEYEALSNADFGVELEPETRAKLIWYRIGQRAKELRA